MEADRLPDSKHAEAVVLLLVPLVMSDVLLKAVELLGSVEMLDSVELLEITGLLEIVKLLETVGLLDKELLGVIALLDMT